VAASLKDIRPDEAGVIKLGKGNIAVRKAANGSLHAVYMGCTVTWNNNATRLGIAHATLDIFGRW
jgi:hypothetical protein